MVAELGPVHLDRPRERYNNLELLEDLVCKRLVEATTIMHGKGAWRGYGFSSSFWRWLRRDHPELQVQWFGPRRAIGSNRDFPECQQAEAIMWFAHAVQDASGEVVDVALERPLKSESQNVGVGGYFDVRPTHVNIMDLRGTRRSLWWASATTN